jgi:hypothetical protein
MMGKRSQMVEQIPFKSGVAEPGAPSPGVSGVNRACLANRAYTNEEFEHEDLTPGAFDVVRDRQMDTVAQQRSA